ncbi:MAG: tetratricopeptide repeat protein [Candidatus Omnitrophica bacterium]|nr:tetratricopeptide repeat protein [Candidatus Omnitrophota bacterium]
MSHSPRGLLPSWPRLLPWLIVLTGLAAYAGSLSGPFLHDDILSIVDNPGIRRLRPIGAVLAVPPGIEPLLHRPILTLSFALNYAVGGLQVFGYHAVNLAIHLLAGLVLYGLLRRTLLLPRLRARVGHAASGLAAAAALIWVAHPLLTESVTYIIQRAESLMGLWYLLTLYCLARSADAPHPRRWMLAAVACCALGMGTKQTMVTAPVAAWLYDAIFLRQADGRRRWLLHAGLMATWLVLAVLVLGGPRIESAGPGPAYLSPWTYGTTQLGVIAHYLRLAVWPQGLAFDYEDWPVSRSVADVWPQAMLVGAWLIATVIALRRCPELGFLGAWFLLVLAPTSSVWPLFTEIAAERRMYLPLIAVVVLVTLGGWLGLQRLLPGAGRDRVRARVGIGLAAALIGALAFATTQRNRDYHNEVAMWQDVAAKRPWNVRARYNLALALDKEGRSTEAIPYYLQVLRRNPAHSGSYNNLGVDLALQGQWMDAAGYFSRALELDGNNVEARNNLAAVWVQLGRPEDAARHLEAAGSVRRQ